MTIARALPYVWYPALVASAIAAFAAMLQAGVTPALAAYVPIAVAAIAIIALESRFPERVEWRPRWPDVKADATFLAVVQVGVPRALLAVSVLAISDWMHVNAASSAWPQAWPLAAQVVTMVLIVDLFRYWLHRACHRFEFLWRFHEVHHSPELLYTLNVGRFHPVEKALHFCADTVPFLLLGVAPEVIAGYFLLYSVNGFFQHSNVRLRYGWLNLVVGSAETHRWHHARDPRTAACNFGNTFIVWDVLFGTWHLPKDRSIEDIGIMDRTYPKQFWAQMLTPFRRREFSGRRRGVRARLADWLVPLQLRLVRIIRTRQIAADVRDPMRAQRAVLDRILRSNRDSTFGRKYGFAGIATYEDFVRQVPVGDFESLRPFIDAEIERGERSLTSEIPLRYVRTSGSTGIPKDVPLTRSHLAALRRIHQTSVACQHRACPEAFAGGILAIVSPAHEGTLANGKPFGSASGIVAGDTPALVLEKFVLPASVLTISDSEVKYLLILRLALSRPDITYLGSANSTTLLTLIRLYREHAPALIDDVRDGTFFLADKVPANVLRAVRTRLRARPDRGAELARLQARGQPARVRDLWPSLRLVVTWTCASAGIAVEAVRRELSPRTRVMELGYVASEFRGTFTLGRRAETGLPTLDTHFFEFVERAKWDSGTPEFVTLDRVRKGIDYYIVVTTPSGLYRYFINDLVRVRGFLHRTPLLTFVQKGKGVTNITGEKLYESQVIAAVGAAMSELGQAARFLMMLAEETECRYRLYVEPDGNVPVDAARLAELVDARLGGLNIEYFAKRESGRLGVVAATVLAPRTGDAYKQFCVESGQREGQFKIVALAYRREFEFDLKAFAAAP